MKLTDLSRLPLLGRIAEIRARQAKYVTTEDERPAKRRRPLNKRRRPEDK